MKTSSLSGAGQQWLALSGRLAGLAWPATAKTTRPWPQALLWLAFLGPFFFLTYGWANAYTARLPHVGSMVFGWERHIPFLPWTIVPYMALDACYAGSLLLCTTRAELRTQGGRLLLASVLSVAGFLAFPLQFSFARPATHGFNGFLFDTLAGFDKPYNQAPSLHVSLALLVGLGWHRHLRGHWRWLSAGWFGLIALSVLTTYQHHFIDVVGGAAVGVLCVHLLPLRGWQAAQPPTAATRARRRVLAAAYALGAALALGGAVALGHWAWLLLWPAVALALVALAYAWVGPAIFQKRAGRLSWAARLLLAPYLAGAWWSSRWLTRRQLPSREVAPGIWLGRMPALADWQHLRPGAVLDLTAEFSLCATTRLLPYRNVPLLDLVPPTAHQLARAVTALRQLHPHAPVLVHCALGYSRGAVVVAAWLLHQGLAATPAEAAAQVRAAQPRVVLGTAHLAALAAYHAARPVVVSHA